jgi:hypothetical protein
VLVPFIRAWRPLLRDGARSQAASTKRASLSKGDAVTGRALAEPVTRAWWCPSGARSPGSTPSPMHSTATASGR